MLIKRFDNKKIYGVVLACCVTAFLLVIISVFMTEEPKCRQRVHQDELMAKIVYSAVMNKDLMLTSDDLTELIKILIGDSLGLNVNVRLINDKVNACIKNKIRTFKIAVNYELIVALNEYVGLVEMKISKFKVGKLPLPKSLGVKLIKGYMGDFVKIHKGTIFVEPKVNVNIWNKNLGLKITKINVNNSKMLLRFACDKGAIGSIIKEKLCEFIT